MAPRPAAAGAATEPAPVPLLRAEDDERLRTTRSGRRVFPKLEFWRNEAIARDADTGAVIGTFQGTAGTTATTPPPAAGKAPVGRRPGRPRKAEASTRAGSGAASGAGPSGAANGAGPSGASPPLSSAPGSGAARKRLKQGDGSPVDAGGVDGGVSASAGGGVAEWSEEQVLALQEAQVEVDPAANNYWQRVAARVPGRSADECYEKLFEDHPTPPREARGAVARHYLEGDGEPGARRRKKLTKAKARKKVRAARWQLKREAQALDEPGGGGATDGASGSEGEGEDGDGQDGADDFYQTVEAQAIADQYIDKFKRQQAQHSRAARGRERAESSRGARGGMDAVLGAGPSDSLAAAIRNAIASVAPRGGGADGDEDDLDKDGEEQEEEEEEEAAPQILFGEGA